ncbi:MAG TPA: hypothetical protein VGF59_00425 [Bryobacteraceae bacterium]
MRRWCMAAGAAIVLGLTVVPEGLDSCAIGPPEPVFSTQTRPADLRNDFAAGRIGIVRGTWQRPYLAAAYRVLAGGKIAPDDAAALVATPGKGSLRFEHPGLDAWSESRRRVSSAKEFFYIEQYRENKRGDSITFYPNCLDDAFAVASRTLEARGAQWGVASANVRQWLAGQDDVFSNCDGRNRAIPQALPASTDPLLLADREYQTAAAYFYAADWQHARDGFERVGRNAASPWRKYAPYLIARTYIREGTLDAKPEAMREAERRLAELARGTGELHDASEKLREFVRIRIDPERRLKELSAELMRPAGTKLVDGIGDFTYLMNLLIEQGQGDRAKVAASSDLADWVLAMESAPSDARDQFRKTHTPAWLIAALMTPAKDEAAEFIAAAHRVRPEEPAYESAVYYAIRQEIWANHNDEARRWADEVLQGNLTLSTRNALRETRLILARDFGEFLKFAPRQPEPKLVLFDGKEEDSEEPRRTDLQFDGDATTAINRLPLAMWLQAAGSESLAANLQLEIAQTGWVRAALLGRDVDARSFMERVTKLQPAASTTAQLPPTILMLRKPALTAFLGGDSPVDLGDPAVRGYSAGVAGVCPGQVTRIFDGDAPRFLTEGQSAQRDAERKKLEETIGAGATYLAREALRWVSEHPADPRAPEVLHLAVEATHYGCKDAQTGEFSQKAFNLLHQNYGKSEWSAKTKYWYK